MFRHLYIKIQWYILDSYNLLKKPNMKKIFPLLIALTLFNLAQTLAQTGKVFDNLSLPSKILKADRKFAIYLPPDYETSNRSYPVLYLLHGAGDNQTGWTQYGELLNIANKAIANGTATAMIIVTPDAGGINQGYFNEPNWNYEDFFFKELIPFIEKNYRVKADKRNRAIAGLSMGGGGAFMYALKNPDMFSSACPLSASVVVSSLEEYKTRVKNSNYPDSLTLRLFNENTIMGKISSMPDKQKNSVRWYIDCGDDDFLYEANALIHILMRKKNIPHEYRVRDGGHTWTYWREALPKVLEFVSESFHLK
jgi:enterochelin esterase-like enzyme